MVDIRFLQAAARHPAVWFIPTLGLSAYILVVYLFQSPPVPLFSWDSWTYWISLHVKTAEILPLQTFFAEMRPLGYGIALHALYRLTGSFRYLPAFQSAAYCLAVLALQAGLWRLTRNIIFASVVAAVLLLFHGLLIYSLFALSEELFIASLVLHIAAAAWALASRSRAALVSMALTAVGIISLRPAGTFVLVGILLFCLFWRGNRIFALRWSVPPLVIGMAIFMAVGLAVRGIAIERAQGLAVFPYVAYLYDGSGDIPLIAEQAIRATLQPYIEGHQEAERDGVLAVTQYEADHIVDIMFNLNSSLSKVLPGQDVSALEGRLAMETIKRHPLQFLRLVVTTFVGGFRYALSLPSLVDFGTRSYQVDGSDIRGQYHLQSEPPIRFISKALGTLGSFDVDIDGSRYGLVRDYPLPDLPISRWHRGVLLILFWIIAVPSTFVAVFRNPSKLGFFTAYTSILAIGGYLLIAVTTVVIGRYTGPLDAFIIVTISGGVLEGLRVMRRIILRVDEKPDRTLVSET